MTRFRWPGWWLCGLVFPAAARADGIDLPILIGYGLGLSLPLLLFNATVEAPILGRFLGVKLADLWWPWFKANTWSLLGGLPVLALNGLLLDWLAPKELGGRLRIYPLFLALGLGFYYAASVLVETMCARRFLRQAGLRVALGKVFKAVVLANATSYLVLGPLFFYLEYPRMEIRDCARDTRWARQPALTVLAIGENGHLEAARADGQGRRVVIPHEVRDYVISADLAQALYRGGGDRFYLLQRGTNVAIPDSGIRCHAPEMDFSPSGRYAAFIGRASGQVLLHVYDAVTGKVQAVPHFGLGSEHRLAWSSRDDSFYLRSGSEYWRISLASEVGYTHLSKAPSDFADHYGRAGTTWSWKGVSYGSHQQGERRLFVVQGWGSKLVVSGPHGPEMALRDPAGQLGIEQAVFLDGGQELLVGLGGYVYLVDIAAKRVGPVMPGGRFIALILPFAKRLDSRLSP